jgi:hypothetical protein
MSLRKSRIPTLTKTILAALVQKGYVKENGLNESVHKMIDDLMINELIQEEALNQEVQTILENYHGEIEKGMLDYKKLFELTKKKLAKERNIVL